MISKKTDRDGIIKAVNDGGVVCLKPTKSDHFMLLTAYGLALDCNELEAERDVAIAERDRTRERIAMLESGGLNQKPFLYALADLYGAPFLDENCVAQTPDQLQEEAEGSDLNILPVYTGPQVIKMVEERDAAIAERDHWKSNHDNQVGIRAAIMDRPDLQERAKLVMALVARAEQAERERHDEMKRADGYMGKCEDLEARIRGLELDTQVEDQDAENEIDAFIEENEKLKAQIAALASPLSKSAQDVLAERLRQINVEGWTPEHDDEYCHAELAHAAACYATSYYNDPICAPIGWPFLQSWWKPKDRRSDLVRAAAMIVAEIERLDRASLNKGNAKITVQP